MSRTKAYIFDFDGTLVDTMSGFADIAAEVINKYHEDVSVTEARKMYLDTSGNPFFMQLQILFPDDPKNEEISKIFEDRKIEGFFNSSFTDEVRSTIETLRSDGAIVGVASNNFQELIDKFIEREGLEFDIVLGYREGFEKGKEHFNFVMNKFSIRNDELTFIGDSLKDAEKAIDNKINFVGICGTFQREDFLKVREDIITIKSIKELLDL